MVGALATAEHARTLGASAVVGGLTWERRPIDPLPGPRRMDEVTGAEVLHEAVALAGPEAAGPAGVLFGEAHMARHLGEPVVLVDPNPGPRRVAERLLDAARSGESVVAPEFLLTRSPNDARTALAVVPAPGLPEGEAAFLASAARLLAQRQHS